MELQGLSSRVAVRLALISALALVLTGGLAAAARASSGLSAGIPRGTRAAARVQTNPSAPVLVTDLTVPPVGYRLTALQVRRIARRDARVIAELRRHPSLRPYEYTKGYSTWQVSWFTRGNPERELLQVYVSDATGRVTQVWTGFQVAWTMARGYAGAFGRRVNAWYVWIPLCILFVAPFLRRRPTLLHLDLLMLLGFSISLAFFNHAAIGLSVPLAYPFLLYLLVRMLLLAFGRGLPREPLRLVVPVSWLAIGAVFLVGFRIGLNVVNSNVIDVGYAGVIGAEKVIHGEKLYGGWPPDNAFGDTYGPVNYYAYVPSTAAFGWSGTWDNLPAAHAAAIAFDLLTLIGLFFLGRMIRGPTLGTVLAYMWAAYPFTLYTLSSNSNDSLVALLIVVALLVARSAPARGVAGALAGLTKFAPFALGPLLLRGTGVYWPRRRSLGSFVGAYVLAAVVVMLPVLLANNLHAFWHDTVAYQSGRGSPFSVWGLWGGLGFEQHVVQGAAAALAVLVAFYPGGSRTLTQVAALGAAVLIALQLGITHWFYLYIPWFFPLVIVALLASHPARRGMALPEAEERGGRAGDVLAHTA